MTFLLGLLLPVKQAMPDTLFTVLEASIGWSTDPASAVQIIERFTRGVYVSSAKPPPWGRMQSELNNWESKIKCDSHCQTQTDLYRIL